MDSRKLTSRFLRSRILPILTILTLFLGWVGIAGLLLWQVKVKEKISSMATWINPPSNGERITLIPLEGVVQKNLRAFGPGLQVELTVESPLGQRERFRTTFLGFETEGLRETMIFSPLREERESSPKRFDVSQPVRVTFEFRQKRLLSSAFEKHLLFQ